MVAISKRLGQASPTSRCEFMRTCSRKDDGKAAVAINATRIV